MNRQDSLKIAQLPASDRTLKVGDNLLLLSDNIACDNACDFASGIFEQVVSPFRIEFTTMLLCVSGHYKIRINLIEYELNSNTLMIIPEGSISEHQLLNIESGLLMIAFSQKLNPLENQLIPYIDKIDNFFAIRLISLTPDEAQAIADVYKIMRNRLANPGFTAKTELAKAAIMTILCFISPYITDVAMTALNPAKQTAHAITSGFLRLLDSHCAAHHNLAFYASQLSITPRHLSRVVAQTSGRSAKVWITERLILEAKVQLNISSRTILQISEALGFPNQSFFGSFFRRATGLSPLAYRRLTHKPQYSEGRVVGPNSKS